MVIKETFFKSARQISFAGQNEISASGVIRLLTIWFIY